MRPDLHGAVARRQWHHGVLVEEAEAAAWAAAGEQVEEEAADLDDDLLWLVGE